MNREKSFPPVSELRNPLQFYRSSPRRFHVSKIGVIFHQATCPESQSFSLAPLSTPAREG
jgi:hypothetical protein